MATKPPLLDLVHHVSTTLRYVVSTSGLYSITGGDIFGALGSICYAANADVRPWASSFKIKKFVVFPSTSSSSATQAEANWLASLTTFVKDELRNEAVPQGMTFPSCITFTPPKLSLANDWITGLSGILQLGVAAGSIIDFHVDYTLSATITCQSVAIATGIAGTIYYLALDGASSNKITPVALPTTS
jgi:hypothetical protein